MREKHLVTIPKEEPLPPNYTALLFVVNRKLSEEIAEDKLTPEQFEKIKKQKLNVYFDAIIRGLPKVFQKLEKEGYEFNIFDTNAKRVYKSWYGVIDWKIVANSQDLFTRAKFLKYMQDEEIETQGVTKFYDDTFLVWEALEMGTKEQNAIFSRFESVANSAKQLLSWSRGVFDHLPSVKTNVSKTIEAYNEMIKAAKTQGLKMLFLENLINSKFDIKILDNLESLLKQTQILFNFFEKDGEPLDPEKGQRGTWERTFFTELVTNKDKLFKGNPKEPKTIYDNILKFHKFMTRVMSTDKQEAKENLFFVVNVLLQKNTANFKALFEKIGIEQNLGFEYFNNMLISRILRDWDARLNYGVDYSEDYKLKGLPHLNNYYVIINKEFVPSNAGNRNSWVTPQSVAKRLREQKPFPAASFSLYEKKERLNFLEQIVLQTTKDGIDLLLSTDLEYLNAIEIIFRSFGIKYIPDQKVFTANFRNVNIKKEAVCDLFTFFANQAILKKQVVYSFEKIFMKAIIASQEKELDLPRDGKEFSKNYRLLVPTNFEGTNIEAKEKIFDYSSWVVLAWFVNGLSKNNNLALIKRSVIDLALFENEAINNSLRKNLSIRHGKTFFIPNIGRLEISQQIDHLVGVKYTSVAEKYLPKSYFSQKPETIRDILQNSALKLVVDIQSG